MSDRPATEVPSPAEMVRRVAESLVDRTLTFARGARIPVRVRPASRPGRPGGLALWLMTLDGRRPALWWLPEATWDEWAAAWSATRPPEEPAARDKALMLLLTGGLDRWSLVARGEGGLPGYPFPTRWDAADGPAWDRTLAGWSWFEVRTPQTIAWLALDADLAATGNRLVESSEFRALVREEVLGEATGRLGAERPWEPSSRGALVLDDGFVLGPCLLPPLDGNQTPRFLNADADAVDLTGDEPLLVHRSGWDDETYPVVYRLTSAVEPDGWEELLNAVGGLLPLASLVRRPASDDEWLVVRGVEGPTVTWLRLRADYGPGGPAFEVLLPPELLNALSGFGSPPWRWLWLNAGADNLLRVFLDANDRFRLRPPSGYGRQAGEGWADAWFDAAEAFAPPPVTMTFAEFWMAVPRADRRLLVQNLLVPDRSLHPLTALFTWAENADDGRPIGYQEAGFDRRAFGDLLPPLLKAEWDDRTCEYQPIDEYRAATVRALEAVWTAWRQGRLELSPDAVDLLDEGFAAVRRGWKLRQARALTGRGWSSFFGDQQGHRDLGPTLQRLGPRQLALALLYDEAAARRVPALTVKTFAAEFADQRRLWAETFRLDGPDLEAFTEARGRLGRELARLDG